MPNFAEFLKPPSVKGLKQLDRNLFKKSIEISAVKLAPKCISQVMKNLGEGSVLSLPGIRSVVPAPKDPAFKLLLLHKEAEAFAEDEKAVIRDAAGEFCSHTLEIDYGFWRADQILRAILPDGIDCPSSFDSVGHIAHVNLREEQLPFKALIGEVLLDKNSHIRTVVNKVAAIENRFRVFPMEVLAGEECFVTRVSEQKCTFELDFSEVYWNSRLQHEHSRIVERLLQPGQFVCDAFCGVGPFAIPAAKKRCFVWANDLNPASFRWLKHNAALNRISDAFLTMHNEDAAVFLPESSRRLHAAFPERFFFDHYVMNLPAIAVEFLRYFALLPGIADADLQAVLAAVRANRPQIHCYFFVKDSADPAKDAELLIKNKVAEFTPHPLHIRNVHEVRSVAPNKSMFCVSFEFPDAFYADACVSTSQDFESKENSPKNKRLKEYSSVSP